MLTEGLVERIVRELDPSEAARILSKATSVNTDLRARNLQLDDYCRLFFDVGKLLGNGSAKYVLMLLSEDGLEFHPAGFSGYDTKETKIFHLNVGEGSTGLVHKYQQPIFIDANTGCTEHRVTPNKVIRFEDGRAISLDGDEVSQVQFVRVDNNERYALAFPLRRTILNGTKRDEVFGVFHIEMTTPPNMSYDQMALYLALYQELIIQRAATGLDSNILINKDHLTKAGNKRAFHEELERRVQTYQSHGDSFAVVYVDFDRFKQINDNYGHPNGDEALIKLVRIINGIKKPIDRTYRIGGDEFAAILQKTDEETARQTCERIRKAVEDYDFGLNGKKVPVTVSIGYAMYPAHGVEGSVDDVIRTLTENADIALYEAKSGTLRKIPGNNAVVSYADLLKLEPAAEIR